MGGQCHALAALRPGNDPVPILREAGWGQKTLPALEFDPPTIQPVWRSVA